MNPRQFPQYLNAPLQVLFWESDELGLMMMFFILGLMFGGVFYLLIIIVPYAYGRFKKKYPRGFLRHMLIFTGIVQLDGYPSTFEKEFIE